MSRAYKFQCGWCGEKYRDAALHECPKIFIADIKPECQPQEILIRGDHLSLRWNKKGEIVIFKEKEGGGHV